jgi:Cu-processing system ATP-binding protein
MKPLLLTLPPPVIELTAVTKRFRRLTVLDRVSFDVRAGRITAILGPNASGKSTVIKMVLGLTRPDTGRILVHGEPVNGDHRYRAQIGYMPQYPHFPENLTGYDVLATLRDLRGECAEDTGMVDELKLEPELAKPVRTMSGGTRQRLNAAAAFMFRPSLLLLDEPTAGLDPIASRILKARLHRARTEGVAVVLTTHVLAEVEELVDDVVLLLEGRVAYSGTLRHLVEMTGQDRLEGAVAHLMSRSAS